MTTAAVATPVARCPRLGRIAACLGRQRRWRRLGLAALFGLLSATAFAPLYAVPLLVPAFMGLLWLLAGVERGRSAFAVGWAFGAGHFLGGLYWVGIAMTVDFARFWWLLPISVAGLALGLGLFIGTVTWIVWRTRATGAARLLWLTAAWLLAEWLRSWVLTGFPWNQLGSVWAFSAETLQLASLTGVWGLTTLTLLAAGAPALLGEAGLSRRQAWGSFAAAWLLLAAGLAFGLVRLSGAPPVGAENQPGVLLRLVQPSVEQSLKWKADLQRQHVELLLSLTSLPGLEQVTHVVWPETAVPYNIWQDQRLRTLLAGVVPRNGLLITGAPRYIQGTGAWNSLYALNDRGEIVATYDKTHLVPFGEYVPLAGLLGAIAVTQGSFTAGTGLTTLNLPGLPPASPLICYEVIFPGAVVADGGARPGLLLNITNDAWFGRSSGPYQHFAQARLRAVEEGLPLVRSANNGISAVIDPYGRVIGRLGLDEVGILDLPLPQPLVTVNFFAKAGNWIVFPLILGLAIIALLLMRRKSINSTP